MATTKGKFRDAREDFDSDTFMKNVRNQKMGGYSRTKLPSDKNPEKYEIIKRLEKEKKAMQRKYMDEEDGKQKRQIKQKKRENTNWIKQYEYGMLDEDDYLDY